MLFEIVEKEFLARDYMHSFENGDDWQFYYYRLFCVPLQNYIISVSKKDHRGTCYVFLVPDCECENSIIFNNLIYYTPKVKGWLQSRIFVCSL